VSNSEITAPGPRADVSASQTIRGRMTALRDGRAYKTYERVRDRVFGMLDTAQRQGLYSPSAYWQEELANFDYMFEASPSIINKLRHHSYHITGVPVYAYRTNKEQARRQMLEKLDELVRLGGKDLLVPESPELGGYGFEHKGALYNIDTLKYYEVIIALQRGEVLREFRDNKERKLVWEIGPGWGGFPYQFKTLCPNTTYVLMDFPELFLFSATYLLAQFPSAKAAFYGEMPSAEILRRWEEFDFIFLPNTALDEFKPPKLHLTINMVSFQEMRTDQVEAYAKAAYDLGCPYLYSLNRDRSSYNNELSNVREIVSRYFWLHDVYVLPVSYTKMLDSAKPVKEKMAKSQMDYAHAVGWRKVKP
jgi:hypothetical protein